MSWIARGRLNFLQRFLLPRAPKPPDDFAYETRVSIRETVNDEGKLILGHISPPMVSVAHSWFAQAQAVRVNGRWFVPADSSVAVGLADEWKRRR